ncbi:MAG: hypothetical protein M3R21_10600 [Candidatus Dormibacteraeota bacterium]|nr:hypothetical protein [Candidatus Dormibacteraeota bacterium]
MKCDICGQDVENLEDLKKHKEEVHPAAETVKPEEYVERPDVVADAPDESVGGQLKH